MKLNKLTLIAVSFAAILAMGQSASAHNECSYAEAHTVVVDHLGKPHEHHGDAHYYSHRHGISGHHIHHAGHHGYYYRHPVDAYAEDYNNAIPFS